MDLMPEITNRQSIKDFQDKSIERDKVDRILEAGRLAPSAKNRQPWRFIVIENPDMKSKIQEASFGQEHVGKAGIIIALCSTNIDYRMPNGQLAHPIDITFAASFMMLQAEHEGLGSCVVTTFDEIEVKELLTVPYKMKVIMLLLVGYPGSRSIKELRKSVDRISAFNHW
jgi:nitroreductase